MVKKNALKVILTVLLVAMSIAVLSPVIYCLICSFMSPEEVMGHYGPVLTGRGMAEIHLLPEKLSFQSYYEVFLAAPNYLIKFWISLILCTVIVAGQVLVSMMGGFSFSKFKFPGSKICFLLIVLLMIMPVQVTLLPNYIVLDKLNLLNSYGALILPGIFLPFGTFLMTQVYRNIPDSIIEAARLDGAGTMRILFYVVAPNGKAGLASLIVLSFIDNWNMVEQPIVFLRDKFQYPLSVFLASVSEQNFSLQFVCGVLSLIPVTLLFFFFQDELAQGLDISSEK